MNQVKLRYARERLSSIVALKCSAVPGYDHEDELEWDDVLKRLRAGTATVNWNTIGKSKNQWGHRHGISDSIEHQVVGKENAAIERRNKAANVRRDKAQEKIRAAGRRVEDELVLGDEAKAMALLDKFAAS